MTIHGFCRRLLATHPAAAGIDPRFRVLDEGEASRLRRRARDRPVHGVDMTFSAPKSVSLVYFLGGERARAAVRQAHDEAVMAGLGYMERQACVVREGRAGSKGRQVAEGFVGGVFCHRTSRALDPQLHTHAVVANLARRADGAYVALDATAIFAQAKTAGYLYQAELRARLTEYLGVEWGVVRNGTAEIKGVPMAVIGQFSKRRRRSSRRWTSAVPTAPARRRTRRWPTNGAACRSASGKKLRVLHSREQRSREDRPAIPPDQDQLRRATPRIRGSGAEE